MMRYEESLRNLLGQGRFLVVLVCIDLSELLTIGSLQEESGFGLILILHHLE